MESVEHLVALKVMRLTRPSLISPLVLTSDVKDLPANLFNNELKQDVTAVQGMETIGAGQFLLLPQSFGNIYLGETFSSYICVHNETNNIVQNVSIKADLQTTKQRVPLTSDKMVAQLGPDDTVSDVIHHEVKEIGTHILVCEVSYLSQSNSPASFRKFFKFSVVKPLDVKTKFYNAESDEVYLEAQVQNITSGPICLEKVFLDASALFTVTALNTINENECVFGETTELQPQACCQFLYCLSPHQSVTSDVKLLTGATSIGKLDIVWRSNLGERGRLQTSQLQRMGPESEDIRIVIKDLPNCVTVNKRFFMTCKIINMCERKMDITMDLQTIISKGIAWCNKAGKHFGSLEPGASADVVLGLVPLRSGLLSISGLRFTDSFLKRTYDFDDIAQVFALSTNESI